MSLMNKSVYSAEYQNFLNYLIAARQDANITQATLANRMSVDQSFISKCERGVRRVDVIELFGFCDALALDPVQFIRQLNQEKSP